MTRFNLFATLIVALAFSPAYAEPAASERMNVVFILVDDLGWTDFGCFGSDLYETPNIDRLASEGMVFRQAYSACTVCSPTRAALLTGKYPARLHITDWIPGLMPENPKLLVPDWTKYLPHEETTIAEVLSQAGYATASIGKWHLGGEKYYPTTQGFDINVAGTGRPSPSTYFAPWKIPTLSEGEPGDYLTDRIGAEAEAFIRSSKDKPFFLYFAHFAVHLPVQGRKDLVEKYEKKRRAGLRHTNAEYAAMVESVDETVGQVRQTLRDLKLEDRTIIFLTSDNGGRIPTTSNTPLRAGKASAYEGGVRVPLVVFWPGVTKPGSESQTPVMTIDYYPTILDMLGLPDAAGHESDGVSIVPLLRGDGEIERDALFWHYPHHQHYQRHGAMPYSAVRMGDYRLIEFHDDNRIELYNIADDIGEQNDLASVEPERANKMRDRLHQWRKEVGAQMPRPNPNYDPSKPQYNGRVP